MFLKYLHSPIFLSKSKSFILFSITVSLLLNGCVMGYRKYPKGSHLKNYQKEKKYTHMYYDLEGTSLFGGYLELRDLIDNHSPFVSTENREVPPEKGIFIKARIELLSPSVAAGIFGYISYATLMIVPSFSTKDGFIVIFDVYQDGKILRTFDYASKRTSFGWIVLLPFFWVNFFTASESKVFKAIGKQFFIDADPLFSEVAVPN